MDTRQAFINLTGLDPTERQERDLGYWGGEFDKRTRDSLPAQLDRFNRVLAEKTNGLAVRNPEKVFAPLFDLRAWVHTDGRPLLKRTMEGATDTHIYGLIYREIGDEWPGLIVPKRSDDITEVYRIAFKREPDKRGHEYWTKQLKTTDIVVVLRDMFEAERKNRGL